MAWTNPPETYTNGSKIAEYFNDHNIGAGQGIVSLNADKTFSIWICEGEAKKGIGSWSNPATVFTSGVELANYLTNEGIDVGESLVSLNGDGTFSIWIYK